jgi:hypothetical protein
VPDELEQIMRLARFRQAHPGVMVGAGLLAPPRACE